MVLFKNTLVTLFLVNSARATSVNVDYTLIDGAEQLLTHFNPANSNIILSHGCWCAKLSRANSANVNLGGSSAVDELDNICRNWIKTRKCSEQAYGCKNFEDMGDLYEIDYTINFLDATCPDTETCLSETCQIDVAFTIQIEQFFSDNPGFSAVVNPECTQNVNNPDNIFNGGTGLGGTGDLDCSEEIVTTTIGNIVTTTEFTTLSEPTTSGFCASSPCLNNGVCFFNECNCPEGYKIKRKNQLKVKKHRLLYKNFIFIFL